MSDWDPEMLGHLGLRSAFDAVVEALEAGRTDNRAELFRIASDHGPIEPKTFDNLLRGMANFGLVVRLGTGQKRARRVRLTTLGRRWLEHATDHGRGV